MVRGAGGAGGAGGGSIPRGRRAHSAQSALAAPRTERLCQDSGKHLLDKKKYNHQLVHFLVSRNSIGLNLAEDVSQPYFALLEIVMLM